MRRCLDGMVQQCLAFVKSVVKSSRGKTIRLRIQLPFGARLAKEHGFYAFGISDSIPHRT